MASEPFSMKQDVFDSVLAVEKNIGSSLHGEAKRYVEKFIKHGKRNGNNSINIKLFFENFN